MPEYKSPQSEPGMDRNVLLIFALMAVVIFGVQFFMKKYSPSAPQTSSAKPAQQPIQPGAPSTQSVAAQIASPPNATAQKTSSAKAPATQQPALKQATSESETVIENGLYRITFTNHGAQVKSWVLKQFNDDQGKPLDMVNPAASAKYGYPLSLWTYDEGLRNTLNSALYVPSTTETQLQAPAQISFEYSDGNLSVRKSFHFDHSYVVGVETSVFSNGSPVSAFPAWPASFGDQTNLPAYEAAQFDYQVNDKTEHVSVKKISGGNTLHGTYNWAGISDSYFASAFIPDLAEDVSVITLHYGLDIPDSSKPDQTKPVDVIGIAAGHPGQTNTRLFAGPKSVQVLESVSVPTISGAQRNLRSIVNFGFFEVLARPLFLWLRWMNQYVHNWGWAIVLQTLIITLALAPLTVYQMKSAIKMQKVQPQMKAIQEKYKKYSMKDPRKQEMNKEIADLYKEHKVNPVGGCLPLLIQMPFLYAYYRMLSVAIDLRQAHWLWIHDLSAADPLYLLPLLMAGSMFLSQKMTPQMGMDPAQQRMMNIMMPVMMGVLFFKFPAGLNLYYAESNLIRIVQQAIMNRTELGREMREIAAKRARKKDK
jgi:YidC/Oxa1 family membrane protein insertase